MSAREWDRTNISETYTWEKKGLGVLLILLVKVLVLQRRSIQQREDVSGRQRGRMHHGVCRRGRSSVQKVGSLTTQ